MNQLVTNQYLISIYISKSILRKKTIGSSSSSSNFLVSWVLSRSRKKAGEDSQECLIRVILDNPFIIIIIQHLNNLLI